MTKKARKLCLDGVKICVWLTSACVVSSVSALDNYYDTKKKKSDYLVQMEKKDQLYREAVKEGGVTILPEDFGEENQNSMQPRYLRVAYNHGFYMGAGAGGEVGQVKFTTEKYSVNYGTDGLLAKVFAGYQWFYKKNLFVSAEIAGDFTTAKNEDVLKLDAEDQWRQKNGRLYGGDASLIFGSRLPSEDVAWFKFGLAAMIFEHDANKSGENYSGQDFSKPQLGYAVGLGFESYVSPRFFVRLVHDYHYYPKHIHILGNYEGTGQAGDVGYTPTDEQSWLGLGYHFTENKSFKHYASSISMKGLYLGGMFGTNNLIMQSYHYNSDVLVYDFKTNNTSLSAGAYGGYFYPLANMKQQMLKPLGVGLDVFVRTNTPGEDYQAQNTVRSFETFGGALMLSYQLANNNHYYFRIGGTHSHYLTARPQTEMDHPKLKNGINIDLRLPAMQLGLGYETMISKRIALRSESTVDFRLAHTHTNDALKYEYTPRVYTYVLGISYRFNQ